MRIGIDFDEVVSATNERLFAGVTAALGREDIPYNHENLDWEDVLCLTKTELQLVIRTISSRHSFHKSLPLIKNCQTVLTRLKKQGHDLFIVSARPTWGLPYSAVWLREHGILPLITTITHRPREASQWEEYKVTEARRLKLDIFIEDAPKTVIALAHAGIPTIIIDLPYNRTIKNHRLIFRVQGWREIPQIIRQLEKSQPKSKP